MKKALSILLSLAMVLALMAGCASDNSVSNGNDPSNSSNPSTADPEGAGSDLEGEFHVGLLITLSGTGQEMGERQTYAAEVAMDYINSTGGVNGAKLVVDYFDAGTDQQSAINAAQLAANTEGIMGIVGPFQSAYNIAFADIILEAEVPTMCLGTSYNVRDLKNPYMWMPRVCDETTSRALAALAIERGIENPCVMWMTNSSGQSQHDAVVAYYEEQGLPIGLDLGFNVENETDYTPIVTQFLNSDCDGLIIIPYANKGAPEIITLLNQYGYDMTKVAGVSSVFSSDLTDIVGDIVGGIFGVGEYAPDLDRPGTQAYVEAFNAKQDTFTSAWTDAITYDAIVLLCEGARLAGANDTESVNAGLEKLVDYTDGAMTDYTYNEDHSLGKKLLINEFDGSTIVVSGEMDAR